MARVMKPPTEYDESDTDTGGGFYDGPAPKPGLYKGVVKKLLLSKVSEGEKKGEQRIMVICDITEGKFKGAGVTKWLQLTKQGSPWVNQFLHSLTDGSEAQKNGIRKAFKEIGYECGDPDSKKRLPIIKIGKKTNPIGMTTNFVTKMRSDDETRAEIARFVIPIDDSAGDDEEDTDLETTTDTDESDGLDEFADDAEDTATEEDSTDEDDPWSVD